MFSAEYLDFKRLEIMLSGKYTMSPITRTQIIGMFIGVPETRIAIFISVSDYLFEAVNPTTLDLMPSNRL